ncbi:DUF5914 domain-containing protein [Dermacoccus nishinomiyaensis]|uniref:DUF5914 domain-containing protein n=1 Tax=Dermacoccus nishinomiyaensis TaxID=1274 RepID=UPI0013F3B938|nr:DUF5914 domain-containing protein [Dermacoccus nishinomiyaensis]NHC31010.1 Rieske (2Fe-2S) protein [Dermacoccus nishinomiyaensis]
MRRPPRNRAELRAEIARRNPIRRVPQPPEEQIRSTWRQAAVPRIERMLARALAQDAGGWHVAAASTDVVAGRSTVRTILGREIALWRGADGSALAGPGACPHMGALLENCHTDDGDVLCRWHGLRLPSEWPGEWLTYPAHDDGVLFWVRLPSDGETPSDAPVLPARAPLDEALVAVYTREARCETSDVIANRLDPWHGAWFHPYAFSHLVVDEDASDDDCLVTDVTFRLNHTYGVPVRAAFTCTDSRTITMTIIDGEGVGSTVETHATCVQPASAEQPARSVIHEATIAHSERPGFRAARAFAPLIRPLVLRTQGQLWVDDLEYAERRYELRSGFARDGQS